MSQTDTLDLRLDFGALEEIESATGGNAFKGEFWADLMGDLNASKMVKIIAACLSHTGDARDKRLAAARAVDLSEVQATVEKIVAAANAAMPDVDPVGQAEGEG